MHKKEMILKESETVELKKSTSELKEAIISMVSILNKHQRGTLYFGIKNIGEIVGQDVSENTLRNISRAISDNIEPRIYPKIREIILERKQCIKVEFSGSEAPYFAYGRAYIRVADENKKLSVAELERFFSKKRQIYWDTQFSGASLSEINTAKLKEYIQKGTDAKMINFTFTNIKTALKKLELYKDEKPLKAFEVLFCDNNPLLLQAAIFAGKDKTTFLDIQEYHGTVFDILAHAETYISKNIHWRVEFQNFKRVEIPEIPIDAIREALVNSLCHRDYFKPEANKISIFQNRVEIWNPGNFPEGLTPEDYIKGEEESVLRNPLIAKILYYSRDIEKWGSGLKRIYDECNSEEVAVNFINLKSGFKVIFQRDISLPKETTLKTTPKTTHKIILILKEKPNITKKELADMLDITLDGVKYQMRKLKEKGLLTRIGGSKNGHWEIIEPK